MSWNIRNKQSKVGNKFSEPEFVDNFLGHDIICLQETKGVVKLQNYKALNSTWPNSKSGGVAILYKNDISRGISQYYTKLSPDAIILKLHKTFFNTKRDFYIINYYIRPSNSTFQKRMKIDPWSSLDEILADLKTKGEIILCGDFNAQTATEVNYILDSEHDIHNLPSDFFRPKAHTDRAPTRTVSKIHHATIL